MGSTCRWIEVSARGRYVARSVSEKQQLLSVLLFPNQGDGFSSGFFNQAAKLKKDPTFTSRSEHSVVLERS